jgi:hypothetical protein
MTSQEARHGKYHPDMLKWYVLRAFGQLREKTHRNFTSSELRHICELALEWEARHGKYHPDMLKWYVLRAFGQLREKTHRNFTSSELRHICELALEWEEQADPTLVAKDEIGPASVSIPH